MTTLELRGRMNAHGQLEIELPPGLPEGEVIMRLDIAPPPLASGEHWGKRVLARLAEADLSAWEAEDIPDVVESVRKLRHGQDNRLKRFWDGQA
jgi:hypothetical protein